MKSEPLLCCDFELEIVARKARGQASMEDEVDLADHHPTLIHIKDAGYFALLWKPPVHEADTKLRTYRVRIA